MEIWVKNNIDKDTAKRIAQISKMQEGIVIAEDTQYQIIGDYIIRRGDNLSGVCYIIKEEI